MSLYMQPRVCARGTMSEAPTCLRAIRDADRSSFRLRNWVWVDIASSSWNPRFKVRVQCVFADFVVWTHGPTTELAGVPKYKLSLSVVSTETEHNLSSK